LRSSIQHENVNSVAIMSIESEIRRGLKFGQNSEEHS